MEKRFDKRVAERRIIAHEEKVFDLDDAENVPQKSFAVYDEDVSYNRSEVMHCSSLKDIKDKKFIFTVENPMEKILKWDFLPNNSDSPLVNKKGLDFISELCPNEFEYYDTIIEAADGIITDFKIINILVSVKIADEEKTIYYELSDGFICGYKKLVAKDNPLEGHNMVRDILTERPSVGIYVSPYFKSEYKKRKLKGASFDDAEYPRTDMNSYEFYNPNTGIWERWK